MAEDSKPIVTDEQMRVAEAVFEATSNGIARFFVGSNWHDCLRAALQAALAAAPVNASRSGEDAAAAGWPLDPMMADGYQWKRDGKWEPCSHFVAVGWGSELSKDCRALYSLETIQKASIATPRPPELVAALDAVIADYSNPDHDCHTNRAVIRALNDARNRALATPTVEGV